MSQGYPQGWTETFRSDVKAWEVDVVEHFTVAYYYEKFEAAAFRFLAQAGLDPRAARTVDCYTRYQSELRAGDLFRIETALIRAGDRPTLAHRMVDVETGTLCTTMEHTVEGVSLDGPLVEEWDGPAREERAPPADSARWVRASTDVVRPSDLDWSGRLGLGALIHLFSGSGFHALGAIGMTREYQRTNRIGLSTFEFLLRIEAHPGAGTPIHVESTLAHLGGSSVRLLHRMVDSLSGETIAELGQFGVHLDLDARRPSRIPDEIREKALAMMG